MFSTFGAGGSFFILPICYHPTTAMMVDDDPIFLKSMSLKMEDRLPLLAFTDVDDALNFIKNEYHQRLFSTRCFNKRLDIPALRAELYNQDRFREIVVTIIDYEMPNKTGLELINTMELPPEIHANSFIMLTGNLESPSDPRIQGRHISQNSFINKADGACVDKLMSSVQTKNEQIFQWASYESASWLAQRVSEKNLFLFDKNCLNIINAHIERYHVCEMVMFDSQGSYLFLDQEGQFSWLIVRNEKGIENTLQLAKQYNAPHSVIEALQSREVILSLYEKSDFERIKSIPWEKYLLPATELTTSTEYLERFRLAHAPTYYYSSTTEFPNHGVEKKKILSYQAFLKQQQD